MGIVSYAQNFEDVMLWRALGHIPNGFYIDVGAQHPVLDSVSKAFYEHGWRGVHVEATHQFCSMLREARPDELVLEVAVSEKRGSMYFYEIPETGLSTGDKSIAEKHEAKGFRVNEISVPCITLDDLFEQIGSRDIHWLKIDVEGMEAKVLSGWTNADMRPWVIVVESTYPSTQVQTHNSWQYLVLEKGYLETYFDGLNRYYVLADLEEVADRLRTPPNIFDGFSLALTTHYGSLWRESIEQMTRLHNDEKSQQSMQYQVELQAHRNELLNHNELSQQQIFQLQERLAESDLQHTSALTARDLQLARQIEVINGLHEEHLQKSATRENELNTLLLQLQEQTSAAKAEYAAALIALNLKSEQALRQSENDFNTQIARLHHEASQAAVDHANRCDELELNHNNEVLRIQKLSNERETDLNSALVTLDQSVQALKCQLSDLNSQILAAHEVAESRQKEVGKYAGLNAILAAELTQIKQTVSWRLTAPLRQLSIWALHNQKPSPLATHPTLSPSQTGIAETQSSPTKDTIEVTPKDGRPTHGPNTQVTPNTIVKNDHEKG
jgi:FkbM family methyltransferase